ncbi:MAG TPA: class I SAM-dependent methyltransferase [Candidatus Dormibacteraeota bacterium]|nr:class I SAM-dependent methyltransferase [Candidatus Dormibacteraeota bacterium]
MKQDCMREALQENIETASSMKGAMLALPESGVEKRVCDICEGNSEIGTEGLFDTRFGIAGRYGTRKCKKCGFEQISPTPTVEELKHLYESQYNFAGSENSRYTSWREWFLFSFLNRWWMTIDGDIAFHSRRGTGRLLDIGCNEGRGLRLYAANGFTVEGLEFNEIAAMEARRFGFAVHTCSLEALAPENRFDVAVLSNVLEHSLEPRKMLEKVRHILNPGGQVWISCPNSASWQRSVFGRSWINWHVPFHISYFSQATLQRLLQQSGFAAVERSQITPALWMTQTWIAALFSREGRITKQLRNPFLTAAFMLIARGLLFPLAWLGNHAGRGDCLIFVATRD